MGIAIERREELLEKIVDVLLSEGVSELSLRPLAASVGTSARLLIYHFGSKEQLLTDALDRVRQRVEASVRILTARENPESSLAEFLRVFWRWALLDSNQRYLRLLFEINGLAMHNRTKFSTGFWEGGFTRWLQVFEGEFNQLSKAGHAPSGASTFVLATLNGLFHDYLATGDRKRTTDGMNCLIDAISVRPAVRVRASKKRTQSAKTT